MAPKFQKKFQILLMSDMKFSEVTTDCGDLRKKILNIFHIMHQSKNL